MKSAPPCRIVLIQPPFVQLSGPYPAPYYLKSFLESKAGPGEIMRRDDTAPAFDIEVLDHSIGLFEKIFCRRGLERIFNDAPASIKEHDHSAVGKNYAPVIERFLSERELWLSSIERLTAFLRGKDTEWGHFLALANGNVPGGPRTDIFLEERDGEVSPDETKVMATKMLDDLADFITVTLDSAFSLVRYTPSIEGSLSTGYRDFAPVKKSLDGYIMENFYRPLLSAEWQKLEDSTRADAGNGAMLFGITIPFPGCLSGALVCAESARAYFGTSAKTAAGGGYVNTELRFLKQSAVFDYFDYISFDRGYASMVSILEHIRSGGNGGETIYKTMYRLNGKIIGSADGSYEQPDVPLKDIAAFENLCAKTVFPDYSRVDFGRYLYPADNSNPMHRLWSDGHWLKAYLAYGCYWHRCAFCDVTLDYIKNFIPVPASSLFVHLKSQAEQTGIRGIHFVDEAAPVSSLVAFSLLNREKGLPLNFWGNIRFEKGFDSGTAAVLAAGGLTGVSAGLELVTERGLRALGKGIATQDAVNACAAFKEAGILTHAYLIYGYWDEDEQEIIDSAEILRQFFENGLLDSAFWHKFILTRHSRIYSEKQRGFHSALTVKDDPAFLDDNAAFALNDLSFEGEEKFDRYSVPLESLLAAWMSGNTGVRVTEAFPFKVKPPSVPPDFISGLLYNYADARDRENFALFERQKSRSKKSGKNFIFLGSVPFMKQERKGLFISWRWRLEERRISVSTEEDAKKIISLLGKASQEKGLGQEDFILQLEKISGCDRANNFLKSLIKNGLVLFPVSD